MDLVLSPFFPVEPPAPTPSVVSGAGGGHHASPKVREARHAPGSTKPTQPTQPTAVLVVPPPLARLGVATAQHERENARVSSTSTSLWLSVLFAVVLRFAVALGPHSGFRDAPKFGDFEAQRHWMEITLHLPLSEWYVGNHPANPLKEYWGLDYPPLTAYHSLACGLVLNQTSPASVALLSSRGDETPPTRAWMRLLAVASDLLTFIPAIVLFYRGDSRSGLLALTSPGLIAIDHGHFQFNCVGHGLTVAAVACLEASTPPRDARWWRLLSPVGPGSSSRARAAQRAASAALARAIQVLTTEPSVIDAFFASILFSLALNFKQMTLYYSPAFFFYLLRWSWRGRRWVDRVARVAACGTGVVLAFAACWGPFLALPDGLGHAAQVLKRVFPFERGLFQDKVANFWCTVNPLFRFTDPAREWNRSRLVAVSAVATLVAFVPSVLALWFSPALSHVRRRSAFLPGKGADARSTKGGERGGGEDENDDDVDDVAPVLARMGTTSTAAAAEAATKPTPADLRWALLNTSSAFFLFSFQVHEKSVLLPSVAALLLLDRAPLTMSAYQLLAAYSMTPLLVKDGVFGSSVALSALFCSWVVFNHEERLRALPRWLVAFLVGAFLVPGAALAFAVSSRLPSPRAQWPDLWVVLLETHAFVGLVGFHVLFAWWHVSTVRAAAATSSSTDTTSKKRA